MVYADILTMCLRKKLKQLCAQLRQLLEPTVRNLSAHPTVLWLLWKEVSWTIRVFSWTFVLTKHLLICLKNRREDTAKAEESALNKCSFFFLLGVFHDHVYLYSYLYTYIYIYIYIYSDHPQLYVYIRIYRYDFWYI